MKQVLPKQSAKFRKDWMSLAAFVLFAGIVFFEIVLAVALPWHLRLEKIWGTQIARQELVDYFDQARRGIRGRAKYVDFPASEEVLMYCRSLDRIAPYLHRYGEYLEVEQCKRIFNAVAGVHAPAMKITKKAAGSNELPLNSKNYLRSLRGTVVPPRTGVTPTSKK